MPTRPLPDLQDPDNGFFWQGTARGEINVKHCNDCGRDQWPPRLGCAYCGSANIAWSLRSTFGTVFSWTVIHRSLTPGFATPYTVLLVELIDTPGVRMVGNLVNASAETLHAGMAVEAVFTPSEDGTVQLICWQPATRQG